MGLLNRLKNRLSRPAAAAGIGPTFTPALQKEWDEIPEQVDAALKKVGSAVVGTWEVGAAELGRKLVGRDDEKALIDRYSDSLVPTLAPFQDLHKRCTSAMSEAKTAALRQGDLAAMERPLLGLVAELGAKSAEGWGKTATYLEPIFALTRDPAGEKARFLEGEAMLRAAALRSEGVLRERLAALSKSKTLYDGICDAFDAYQLALGRDLEIGIDARAKALVKAVGA